MEVREPAVAYGKQKFTIEEYPRIGILLYKGKEIEVIEYAIVRNISPAVIADYQTKLLDRKILTDKLHQLTQVLGKTYHNE